MLSNFRRLSFPFKCSFAVTYRCNMRCSMCNIWKKPKEKEITVEEVDSFFRKARRFFWVGITGGEPFMREDIYEVAETIIKHSDNLCALHFATNGILGEKIKNVIRRIRKKYKNLKLVFTVSIDGTPELHNSIRGVQDSWARTVDTFRYLKEIPNVKTQLGFTISRSNTGKFKETFESIREKYPPLRFDDINVNIFQKSTFYYDNNEMDDVGRKEVFNEIEDILFFDTDRFSINNFLRRQYLKLYPRYCENRRSPVKCQAMSSTVFIDPYGDIFPCAVFKRKLANIREMKENFESLWNSDEARKISRECMENLCPLCWSPCDAYSAISGSLFKLPVKV